MAAPTVPQERLDIVEELWRMCVPSGQIEARLSAEWGVTRRTIRAYLAKVVRRNAGMRREAERAGDINRMAEFQRSLGMVEDVYLRSLEGFTPRNGRPRGPDLKTAIVAVHRRAQLLGQYPAGRFELSGPGGTPLEVSPADAVAALQRELAQLAERSGGAPAPAAAPPGDDEGTT